MEFGFSIPIIQKTDEQLRHVERLKDLGIKEYWIGDNPPLNNAFLSAEHILSRSEDIYVGTGITSPFYYSKDTAVALSYHLIREYGSRFILGLGLGRRKSFCSLETKINFNLFCTHSLEIVDNIRKKMERNQIQENFLFAIGGLGNKIAEFSIKEADIFLVNSSSPSDLKRIERIYKRINKQSKSAIVPYCMMQVKRKDEPYSLKLWNVVKEIAKHTSQSILKEHNYTEEEIKKIKQLPDSYMKEIPKSEVVKIVNDFALVGTVEDIIEKINFLKKEVPIFNKMVLGWVDKNYSYSKITHLLECIS